MIKFKYRKDVISMRNISVYNHIPPKTKIKKTSNLTKIIVSAACLFGIFLVSNKVSESVQFKNELAYVKSKLDEEKKKKTNVEATITTCNLKNKFQLDEDKSIVNEAVINLINNNTNIICIQEGIKSTVDNLKQILDKKKYYITGGYRYGNVNINLIPNMANEGNNIISKNPIYMSRTVGLPWIPQSKNEWEETIKEGSIMRRIATHCVTSIDGVGFCYIYNTHLDYGSKSIQKRQMEKILEVIDANNSVLLLPVVIAGDWNATIESSNMQFFIQELQKRNINLVPIKGPTYKGEYDNGKLVTPPKQVDYIGVSDTLLVISSKIITNKNSDHDIIHITIKKICN